MDPQASWERYQRFVCVCETIGLALDVSRMAFEPVFLERMRAPMQKALEQMDALEKGAISNVDEKRRVGHYWLRAPELAPEPSLRAEIEGTLSKIKAFARGVHEGRVRAERGGRFEQLLVVGIGGSALGPQLCADALATAHDPLRPFFFDNTDPDGFDRVLAELGGKLDRTLTVVISKSGGTKETRNGMLEAKRAYEALGLDFGKHAVAVTGEGSELDKVAQAGTWLERFPMWDWVGGRTSELSAVGLLPAALQGIDIDALLRGARDTDQVTRGREVEKNPAALLALMWHHATSGKGQKDMVVLPYKDRLGLFSRYLQQLVMESLGKERDLDGKVVNQGISVYGNKGSTDQHAYVQQLRDGVNNFFVTFVQVLQDRFGASHEVEPGITSGDYLNGFLLGTRKALQENGRESMTITLDRLGPYGLGVLIALYERAVGLYANLVNINAYHQPGVEAGKKAAQAVLELQGKVVAELGRKPGPRSAAELSQALGTHETETVFHILQHLSSNSDRRVRRSGGAHPSTARFEATMPNPLQLMQREGQSPWHDNIKRFLLTSGKLQKMIEAGDITGLTSNPTIFEQAISQSSDYDDALRALHRAGKSHDEIFEALAVEDIRAAAKLFLPVFERTRGDDGYVSIEVSPKLAHDTQGTLAEARRLWKAVDAPNAMVKIPATVAGLGAIEACIAEGMNINVTLIFSLERYDAVMEAFLKGLEKRAAQGLPLERIFSVASFFVSRVDSLVDGLLEEKIKAGGDAKKLEALLGKAAIANAKLAYQAFLSKLSGPRWQALEKAGARKQKPLWASTSTKNPRYPDVYYVEALIGPQTVETMPPATIDAYRDHGKPERRIDRDVETAKQELSRLAEAGIDMKAVTHKLEVDGVAAFAKSFDTLMEAIDKRVRQVAS